MGCDIHAYGERRNADGKWTLIPDCTPFQHRNYSLFAWLADVRNYSAVTPISNPRGAPPDISESAKLALEDWSSDAHSVSWLSVEELLAVDYDQQIEDRRVTRQLAHNLWSGGCTAEPGEGKQRTLREFLGSDYFDDLEELKEDKAERVVFWFDN